MIRWVALVLVILAILAALMNAYLGVNDLAKCGASPSNERGCESAEAIVVLSGGDTLARTDHAIELYKNKWAELMIFSGAASDKSGPSNARVMSERAMQAGVPARSIRIDETSENTKQNAQETKTIFENERISTAIVVTSAYHQRRALTEFTRRLPQMTLRGAPVAADKQWSQWWWLTFEGWKLATTETVKNIYLLGGR